MSSGFSIPGTAQYFRAAEAAAGAIATGGPGEGEGAGKLLNRDSPGCTRQLSTTCDTEVDANPALLSRSSSRGPDAPGAMPDVAG